MADSSRRPSAPVITRLDGRLARVTLNRPDALHALNTDMCRAMLDALLAWRADETVEAVLIDHAPGTRGFCAGGDIRMLSEAALSPSALEAAKDFFFTEYRVNWLLKEFGKPTIAVMDGVVMGGGVGLSAPCRFRVATERTTYAMPESAIGLFPDVGGGWWLPRLPGCSGLWLALTGSRLKAADCLRLGIATHFVESARLPELEAGLLALARYAPEEGEPLEGGLHAGAIADLVDSLSGDPGSAPVEAHLPTIDACFSKNSVEEILAALRADGSEWALKQADLMTERSPQAMKVAFRQLHTGARLPSFADNMAMEYRLATRVVVRPDFREGVRAVLVDKDGKANWSPATLEDVDDRLLDGLFARLPTDMEWTPPPGPDRG